MIGRKTKAVWDFWERCRAEYGIATRDFHATTTADPQFLDFSDPLLDLSEHPRMIAGRQKQGTAHLAMDFEINAIARREIGDYVVFLDYDNNPLSLVRIVDVLVAPFDQVPVAFAEREGEGDLTLKYWRDAHRAYFQPQCAKWDVAWREDLPTVCESFELVDAAGTPPAR